MKKRKNAAHKNRGQNIQNKKTNIKQIKNTKQLITTQ
jgi:hypothetical protein